MLIKFGEPSQLSSGSANPRMTATKELGSRTASSVRADLEKGRDTPPVGAAAQDRIS